jgi:hypothetical protein
VCHTHRGLLTQGWTEGSWAPPLLKCGVRTSVGDTALHTLLQRCGLSGCMSGSAVLQLCDARQDIAAWYIMCRCTRGSASGWG